MPRPPFAGRRKAAPSIMGRAAFSRSGHKNARSEVTFEAGEGRNGYSMESQKRFPVFSDGIRMVPSSSQLRVVKDWTVEIRSG